MRRTNLVLAGVIIALLAVPLAVMAASNENYRDKFDDGNYDGSVGSIQWEPVWTEVGDDDSHTSGLVRVVQDNRCASGHCLRIRNTALISLSDLGAQRHANTSMFTSATLQFRIEAAKSLLSQGTLYIEVSENGGATWTDATPPQSLSVLADDPDEDPIDISDYASDDFVLRFRVAGLLGSGTVYIDDVEIKGEVPTTTTTTTTTNPTTTTTNATTSTSRPTTTTTTDRSTTTSSDGTTTSTSHETPTSEDRGQTTSTTEAGTTTTTTTSNEDDGSVVALGPDEPPADGGDGDGGLRQATRGIQAGLHGSMFADVNLVPMFDPVDVDFNFGLFAEEIETSWLWMTLFGLVLTWALVSDLDRRRFKRHPPRVSAPAES